MPPQPLGLFKRASAEGREEIATQGDAWIESRGGKRNALCEIMGCGWGAIQGKSLGNSPGDLREPIGDVTGTNSAHAGEDVANIAHAPSSINSRFRVASIASA